MTSIAVIMVDELGENGVERHAVHSRTLADAKHPEID